MLRICEKCGKDFKAYGKRALTAKLCSIKCRRLEKKKCAQCGKSFKPSAARILCCSNSCAGKYRAPKLSKAFNRQIEKACVTCGAKFKVSPYRKDAQFCQQSCQRPNEYAKKECLKCGKSFIKSNRKYCSDECLKPSIKIGRAKKRKVKKCKLCFQSFVFRSSEYCSDECGKAGFRMLRTAKAMSLEEKKIAEAGYRSKRRSKTNGSFTAQQWCEKVKFFGYRCYLCGDDESKLTIEHRIPLSRGGSNFVANLAPACKSCNSRKFNRTEKEFRAILAANT